MYDRKIKLLERQKQLQLDTEKEKDYEKLIAAQDNLKLVETKNKITQEKIQLASDISISEKDFLDKFEHHTTH